MKTAVMVATGVMASNAFAGKTVRENTVSIKGEFPAKYNVDHLLRISKRKTIYENKTESNPATQAEVRNAIFKIFGKKKNENIVIVDEQTKRTAPRRFE